MAFLSRMVAFGYVLVLLLQIVRGEGPSGYEVISTRCGMRDKLDSEYQRYVREVEETLRKYTAKKGYSTYYDTEDRICFGFSRCDYHKLSPYDCENCLNEAWAHMEDSCGTSLGAEVVLSACQMRYEEYDFKYHTLPRWPNDHEY